MIQLKEVSVESYVSCSGSQSAVTSQGQSQPVSASLSQLIPVLLFFTLHSICSVIIVLGKEGRQETHNRGPYKTAST